MCVCRGQSRTEKMGEVVGHGAVIDQSGDREESSYII
jgi:hypothetical protein